jgi:hypothetical protein
MSSLQLSAASSIFIHYTVKKESGGRGKGNYIQAEKCTVGQACWQTWIFRRSVGYIRISPECLPVNLNFQLIWLGKKSRKRTHHSGKPENSSLPTSLNRLIISDNCTVQTSNDLITFVWNEFIWCGKVIKLFEIPDHWNGVMAHTPPIVALH